MPAEAEILAARLTRIKTLLDAAQASNERQTPRPTVRCMTGVREAVVVGPAD